MNLHMLNLKKQLSEILKYVPNRDNVIYLDFPMYYNVGDLLIMEGTLQFFKENNIKIKKYLNARNYSIEKIKKVIDENTVIICQGGGNFGDIYDAHQNLRTSVIKNFPNNRIIVLPQTALFSNKNKENEFREIIKKHKDVILFARDQVTYELFQTFTLKAHLMPDMAHYLYSQLKVAKKNNNILYFLRKDVEKNPLQIEIESKNLSYDWKDLISFKDKILLKFLIKIIAINNRVKLDYIDDLVFKIWHNHSKAMINKFSRLFSSYNSIITSRLHGHILACLIDTPSTVIDNSYGKNSAYYEMWTKKLNYTELKNEAL